MIYEYRDIVLGSSLEAVVYSFNNRYPLFFSEAERPFRFDYFEPDVDFDFLKLSSKTRKTLTTFDGEKRIGLPKELLWERLLFLLSLDGNMPTSNLCTSMRLEHNAITCFNEYSKIAKVHYEKLHDFTASPPSEKIMCCDWVAFNSGGKHEIDFIRTDDDFVREIWFYSSDRICGNTKVKDACAISSIDKQLIEDFDFSETMARFKVVREMEKRGMKGLLSSYGPNGKPKHYKFKTSTIARQKKIYDSSVRDEQFDKLDSSSFHYQKYLRHL